MPLRDLRNLPAELLERLGTDLAAPPDDSYRHGVGFDARSGPHLVEARQHRVELRADADEVHVDGYATVYEEWYDVLGGPPYGWREMIARGAAAKSIRERDDVRLLFDHEGIPLARTAARTLTLFDDDDGLRVDGTLDLASPYVQSIRSAMARGDLDQMSFAFRATRQEWNDDYTERTIREVQLFDVSLVTYPANPATVAQLRRNANAQHEPRAAGLSLELAKAIADQLRTA